VDEGHADALRHENDFLRVKIREAGELVAARDEDLEALRAKARGRIDVLNAEIAHLQGRVEQLHSQLKGCEAAERRREALQRDVQEVQRSSRDLCDALQESDAAHACTQGHLRCALQQLQGAHEQLAQQEVRAVALQAELSAARLGLAVGAAGSTAVLKAKEAAFYQAQLKRVHARMAEQEQELQLSAKAQRSIAEALTVQECGATKRDELLVTALQTNTQLERSYRKQLAVQDAALSALQRPSADRSDTGAFAPAAVGPAPAAASAAPVPAPSRSKRPRPAPDDALCSVCWEADYGMMPLCQNRGCAQKFHPDCYAQLGPGKRCPSCEHENEGGGRGEM